MTDVLAILALLTTLLADIYVTTVLEFYSPDAQDVLARAMRSPVRVPIQAVAGFAAYLFAAPVFWGLVAGYALALGYGVVRLVRMENGHVA